MKTRCLMIAVLLFASQILFAANGQFTLTLTSDNEDGPEAALSSYFLHNYAGWSFLNTTKIKHSAYQSSIAEYYQESYLRHLLQGIYHQKNWAYDFGIGLGISPGENHPLQPEGLNALLEPRNSLSLSNGFLYDNKKLYLELNMDYFRAEYDKYNLGHSQQEKAIEYDLLASLKTGVWLNEDLLLYAAAEHFNDLNRNDYLNYSRYQLAGRYLKRLNYIHFLEQNVALGYSDLSADYPGFLQTRTRLSSRYNPNWTLLQIINYETMLKDGNFYLGNTWFKTLIRRNLQLSPHNQLSYLQAAAQYEFLDETGFTELAAHYFINKLEMSAAAYYHFGNRRWLDNQYSATIGWSILPSRLSLKYIYSLLQKRNSSAGFRHSLICQYSLAGD